MAASQTIFGGLRVEPDIGPGANVTTSFQEVKAEFA